TSPATGWSRYRPGSAPGTGDDLVFGQGGGHGVVLAGQGLSALGGRLAQPGSQRRVGEHRAHRVSQPPRVAGRDEQRGVLAGEQRYAADPGGHNGDTGAQRLLQDERLAFPRAGQHEHGGGGQQGGYVVAVPGEPGVEAEARRLALQGALERALARDDQE